MSRNIQGTVVSPGVSVAPGARYHGRIPSLASELPGSTGRRGRSVAALLPITAVVFVVYLVIGLALPVLPLHVHRGLGLGTFVVGLVAGSQFPDCSRQPAASRRGSALDRHPKNRRRGQCLMSS
jgi:hypothetical protein